jgi:hypothetical protein
MPVYEFKNLNTGKIVEHTMKISELDEFKKNNPHLERHITSTPGLSDPVRMGLMKPATGFRELLSNIKQKNRGSTVNDF